MQLEWIKCDGDRWCSFTNVDLSHSHFDDMKGVYVIFQKEGKVVRLGQGIVKDRISSHRKDYLITKHNPIYVTWAKVDRSQRDGVEKFLANKFNPIIGDAFPNVIPITVNLPQ
ncbi:MAG: hypothetical protein WCX46_03125 [Candidatus Paceibacterota bacterium]